MCEYRTGGGGGEETPKGKALGLIVLHVLLLAAAERSRCVARAADGGLGTKERGARAATQTVSARAQPGCRSAHANIGRGQF